MTKGVKQQQLETRNVPEIFLTNETQDQNYTITIRAKFKVEELIIAAQESTQVPVTLHQIIKVPNATWAHKRWTTEKVTKGKVSLNLCTQGGGIQNIDTVSCYRRANLPSTDILSLFWTQMSFHLFKC